jgi:hypothetical protein
MLSPLEKRNAEGGSPMRGSLRLRRLVTGRSSDERELVDDARQSQEVDKQREKGRLTARERVQAVAEALSHRPRGLR